MAAGGPLVAIFMLSYVDASRFRGAVRAVDLLPLALVPVSLICALIAYVIGTRPYRLANRLLTRVPPWRMPVTFRYEARSGDVNPLDMMPRTLYSRRNLYAHFTPPSELTDLPLIVQIHTPLKNPERLDGFHEDAEVYFNPNLAEMIVIRTSKGLFLSEFNPETS